MLVKLIRNPTPTKRTLINAPRPFTIPNTGVIPMGPPINRTLQGINTRALPPDWTKHRFSLWVEGVKEHFKRGQLVTLKVCPPQPNVLPFHFRIMDINEVHHFATWDRVAFEPEALMVESPAGIMHKRAPSVMRHLTEEELRLVILQDTKPQGTA